MNDTDASALDVQHAIDREVDLVMSAVNLVANGGSPSVIVAGLRLTDAVIEIVLPAATLAGVVLEPLWGPDETACDVRVRRIASV